jgi:hypothetical protein
MNQAKLSASEPISVNEFEDGYPNLATFQSSDEVFALYRRFGYLQSRLLLEKQDVLRVLEKRLNEYDNNDRAKANRRILKPHQIKPREELLGEIEKAFNSYGAWNSPSRCPGSEGQMLLWSLELITRFNVQPLSSSLRSSSLHRIGLLIPNTEACPGTSARTRL